MHNFLWAYDLLPRLLICWVFQANSLFHGTKSPKEVYEPSSTQTLLLNSTSLTWIVITKAFYECLLNQGTNEVLKKQF